MIGMLLNALCSRTRRSTIWLFAGRSTLSVRRNIRHEHSRIIAVDNSPAMIERCRRHIDVLAKRQPVEVVEGDIRDITH
ncbi:hypothetical protein KCP69_17765 [Salmonella enterica subsp. enterica]|nr:hypothetical protein KCP69_17765 [Salmonella enterica subsp. enterica]